MSYFYGYGKLQHSSMHTNLDKKIADLEKKFKNLSLDSDYKTVFDINFKTAKRTYDSTGTKLTAARNGKYCMFQNDKKFAPLYGDDYIQNKTSDYMCFVCPELQFGDISIFIVCEVADTTNKGDMCYLIGNDNGGYDKFIAFKSYSYYEAKIGGVEDGTFKTVQLPSSHSILHKHILSAHWLSTGSCMYANAVKIPGSDFQPDITDIGNPYGSVFFIENFNSHTAGKSDIILRGKIYGFKIVYGPLLPTEIVKINKDMMKEYGNFV